MPAPPRPKLYHIVHADRLPSIIADGHLWSDAEVMQRSPGGTTIGMEQIKQRRLEELRLASHPDLHVGECAPFYFCPRSVMLFVISKQNNPDLPYRDGQGPIVHLEADLHQVVRWADAHERRWAFTTSNAGSRYFADCSDLRQLDKLNWDAIAARDWRGRQNGKQAEFLVERSLPWELIDRIGVLSARIRARALQAVQESAHRPPVEIKRDWYY